MKDYARSLFDGRLEIVTMEYIPEHEDKTAALNFHLTQREKKDLLQSVYSQQNQTDANHIKQMLSK
jgi:UTP-glucose-1-phosphate uridylyltransferase